MDSYRRIIKLFKDESFFLFGPRGTGKSLLMKEYFKDQEVLKIDLLLPSELRKYSAEPEHLLQLIQGNPHIDIIIIDEIQKVPDLLSIVHHQIEESAGKKKFVLTGSSARKIKRAGVDLLGGRALRLSLFPFVPAELKSDFNLEDALRFGLIPLVFMSKNKKQRLQAYIDLYLKEEIKAEGLVKNLGAFSRFLETMSFSHGELLNISNISRDCGVERKSIERYIEILEDTLIAERLPVFDRSANRETIAHSKFYFFDTGVFHALIPLGVDAGPRKGALLEGLVFQVLRAHLSYSEKNGKLHFWHTKAGTEIDFIVDFGTNLFAIEVKSARKINRKELRGLKTFLMDYPNAKGYFVYQGHERLKMNNILCIPAEDFLKNEVPKIFSSGI